MEISIQKIAIKINEKAAKDIGVKSPVDLSVCFKQLKQQIFKKKVAFQKIDKGNIS